MTENTRPHRGPVSMNLGVDPLDPHGDGTIREGDPMFQLLMGGAVHATRSQEDPSQWDVTQQEDEVNGSHTHDWYEPVSGKPKNEGPGFGQKLFGFFWVLLGVWMLGTAFGWWADRDLNVGGTVLYLVIAGFNFTLAWYTLTREPKSRGRW